MNDSINRADALEEMAMAECGCSYSICVKDNCNCSYIARIKALPSTETIRGKWEYCEHEIADHVDGYKCSNCGFFIPWDYEHKFINFIKDYNFCPSCRADMRGENK